MSHLILAINPGSTSTKIGLFKDEVPVFTKTIEHDHAEIQKFPTISSQKDFRLGFVLEILEAEGINVQDLAGIVGIGGLLPPIETGGYRVTAKMVDILTNEVGIAAHASNLGAILAYLLVQRAGCQAFIYDAVSAGILPDVARMTGFPEIKRRSLSHTLNSRAQSIQYAKSINKGFDELNLIIAHIGGGVSLSVYEKGRLVDSVGDDLGPFSSERSGTAPLMEFVDFIFDNNMTKKDAQRRIRGGGGLKAHLGTASMKDAQDMIDAGNNHARLVVEAMCYGISKAVATMAVAIKGRCDAIILTGGITRSALVTGLITERVEFIAPVVIMPGEYELEALAAGCLRIITGQEKAKVLVGVDEEGIGVTE
ncbi:MAG: butyrate kinase [Defluviitaleaceae bacterium]|nr:butyrate kinase [Defluviitaleaceae bacterium]